MEIKNLLNETVNKKINGVIYTFQPLETKDAPEELLRFECFGLIKEEPIVKKKTVVKKKTINK